MSTKIKRYVILTPFERAEAVAGILALHDIDSFVVRTQSGVAVVRELKVPQYDEWDIRNITGPDEWDEEEGDYSDNAPAVAATLSRLSDYGVVLIDVDLGEDVGLESGISGQVRARRFLAGKADEEISAGALLNVIDPLIEKMVLGYVQPQAHGAINSAQLTTAQIAEMVGYRESEDDADNSPDRA